jgi:MFS family permease
MEESRNGVWRNRNILAMGFTSLFADLSYEMGNAVLPSLLVVTLGGSPLTLGLVEGISDGASSISKSFSGYVSDRLGRRKPLINIGYLMTGILIPVIGIAGSAVQVLVLKTLAWFGRGLRGPPRDALIAESVDSGEVGRAFGLQRAMDQVGAVLGPLLALVLGAYMSYSQIFIVGLVPGIVAFMIVLLVVREASAGYKIDQGTRNPGFGESIGMLPRRFKMFVTGAGIFGIANFANTLFVLRARDILTPQLGSAQASLASFGLYGLLNAVYSVASYPVGQLGDRWSKRNLLVAGYVLFSASAIGIIFVGASLAGLALVFALAGLHVAFVDTSEAGFAADLLPEQLRGTGYGLLHTVNGIGDLVSSVTVGWVWILFSPFAAFGYAASLSLASALLMVVLTR